MLNKVVKYSVILLFFSCSTSKVVADFNEKTDFSTFKTYSFYEDFGNGLNDFDKKRVVKNIDKQLNNNNIKKSEQPNFFINVISKYTESQNNTSIGIGLGSGGVNGGFGVSGGIPIGGKKLNEEFTLEFVNAKTDSIFWSGRINSTIKEKRKPKEKENHFKKIIKLLIENYLQIIIK